MVLVAVPTAVPTAVSAFAGHDTRTVSRALATVSGFGAAAVRGRL